MGCLLAILLRYQTTYCLVLSRLNYRCGAFIQQLKNRYTETSMFIIRAYMHIYKDVKLKGRKKRG